MRVPSRGLSRISEQKHEGVVAEIAQEKAASLGRAGKRLSEALARLDEHEAGTVSGEARAALVAAAGEALWCYVVQREACGLRDVEAVLREYRVPREVWLRMGPRPTRGP